MKQIIVFICTPRCGTQWITKYIDKFYNKHVLTKHEPIKYDYFLRVNIGNYKNESLPVQSRRMKEHLNWIDDISHHKTYIEVGWQSIGGIPELINRFGNRIRLIHLYRNPVLVAASMVTHNWYTGEPKERHEKAELTPFDESSILKYYRDSWHQLTLFEKCLFYWTEINFRAIEIKNRYKHTPVYSLKFENLFNSEKEISRMTLIKLLSFMNLEYNNKILDYIDIKIDKYRYLTKENIDWKQIKKHSQTLKLANTLSYKFEDKIELGRYKSPPVYMKVFQKLKSLLKLS